MVKNTGNIGAARTRALGTLLRETRRKEDLYGLEVSRYLKLS